MSHFLSPSSSPASFSRALFRLPFLPGLHSSIFSFPPVFFFFPSFSSLSSVRSLSPARSLSLLDKGAEACSEDIRQMDFLHVIKVTLARLCWEISVVLFKRAHEPRLKNSEAEMRNKRNELGEYSFLCLRY